MERIFAQKLEADAKRIRWAWTLCLPSTINVTSACSGCLSIFSQSLAKVEVSISSNGAFPDCQQWRILVNNNNNKKQKQHLPAGGITGASGSDLLLKPRKPPIFLYLFFLGFKASLIWWDIIIQRYRLKSLFVQTASSKQALSPLWVNALVSTKRIFWLSANLRPSSGDTNLDGSAAVE